MEEILNTIKTLKINSFRPYKWKVKVAKKTGFSISYVEKVLDGKSHNLEIALAIISHFNSESKKLLNLLNKAKI